MTSLDDAPTSLTGDSLGLTRGVHATRDVNRNTRLVTLRGAGRTNATLGEGCDSEWSPESLLESVQAMAKANVTFDGKYEPFKGWSWRVQERIWRE